MLGRSWVTKGGSGERRSYAEECVPAEDKSSNFLLLEYHNALLVRFFEIEQTVRLYHIKGV